MSTAARFAAVWRSPLIDDFAGRDLRDRDQLGFCGDEHPETAADQDVGFARRLALLKQHRPRRHAKPLEQRLDFRQQLSPDRFEQRSQRRKGSKDIERRRCRASGELRRGAVMSPLRTTSVIGELG
jgi:hypothetical protein